MTTPDNQQRDPGWFLPDDALNDMQIASIGKMVDRARHAHHTDVGMRINGKDENYQADWLKHLRRTDAYNFNPNAGDADAYDFLHIAAQNLRLHIERTAFANNALPEQAIGWIEAAVRLLKIAQKQS